jgi:hypothetical protein
MKPISPAHLTPPRLFDRPSILEECPTLDGPQTLSPIQFLWQPASDRGTVRTRETDRASSSDSDRVWGVQRSAS